MLGGFLNTNREALIARCRQKVSTRRAPRPIDRELEYGIPFFLDQLIETLRLEEMTGPSEAGTVSPATQTVPSASAIGRGAAHHGNELLRKGFTVDQVVHDYGDLCQAITEMAAEQRAAISADEFRVLNRCLDEAIADAVSEFGRQRDQFIADESTRTTNERLGFFAHELRNLVGTVVLAVATMKRGHVGMAGPTGALLDRSLVGLRDLIDRTLVEVRLTAGLPSRRERVAVADVLADAQICAAIEAANRDLEFVVAPIEDGLTVDGDRQILAAAAANLLQNAIKFTRPHGRISLAAYAVADRILIEVQDECGGLSAGTVEELFRPFEQFNAERTGLGLGLPISRRGVEASGGKLYARNLPGEGCVFTIDLPRAAGPTGP